jgi:hypothetical protein
MAARRCSCSPALSWADFDGETRLRLTGLADRGNIELAVFAGECITSELFQPTAGRFLASADCIDFVPRFPFLAGVTYSLAVSPCAELPEGLTLGLRRETPAADAAATVTAIYPDVEIVPFNLLKVYVEFSEPMAEGFARRGVRIEDADTGEPLDGAFLDMDPELWDPERRRLTLLLDPGRIKRGLEPHQEAGYPLKEGQPIRLTVGAPLKSAAGAPIAQTFNRVYAVGPALRRPVDPAGWRVDFPGEGSPDPLRVEFDRPLDSAMLKHAFQVIDTDRHVVTGAGAVLAGELGWTFKPSQAWLSGEHHLIVNARLEDLAGNSLRRVFDRDLTIPGDFVTQAETVEVKLTGVSARPRGPHRVEWRLQNLRLSE